MGNYPELGGLTLDRVYAYSDRLSFLIPHHWLDEWEADGNNYLYFAEDGSDGWLRASLLCVTKNGTATTEALRQENLEVAEKQGQELLEAGETLIRRYREYSEREGPPICNCYWIVSRCMSPDLIYRAIFTYTVTSEQLNQPKIQQLIGLIGECVSESRFAIVSENVSSGEGA